MSVIPETRVLVLHLAGSGNEPFPDLATAMGVTRNAAAELTEVEIEILVQGPSVAQLVEGETVAENPGRSISIYACGNSLQSAKIDPSTLHPEVKVTPAAVAHIARRQFDGAAYMRL